MVMIAKTLMCFAKTATGHSVHKSCSS